MGEGRAKKMYKDSPKLSRGESGDMEVTRKSDKEPVAEGADKKEEEAGLPTEMRHMHERNMMYAKHEMDHAMHERSGGGEKGEMHARHQKEMADMHSRHEGEHGKMIDKVESDKGE